MVLRRQEHLKRAENSDSVRFSILSFSLCLFVLGPDGLCHALWAVFCHTENQNNCCVVDKLKHLFGVSDDRSLTGHCLGGCLNDPKTEEIRL